MAKKHQFDFFKLWPIGLVAVSGIAGYVTLRNDVAAAKENIKDVVLKQETMKTEYSQVQVSQAKIESKLESTTETLSDIKSLIKDLANKK